MGFLSRVIVTIAALVGKGATKIITTLGAQVLRLLAAVFTQAISGSMAGGKPAQSTQRPHFGGTLDVEGYSTGEVRAH